MLKTMCSTVAAVAGPLAANAGTTISTASSPPPHNARTRSVVVQCPAALCAVPDLADVLLIRAPWIDLILSGEKSMEIRGRPTQRGSIYLAQSGTGMVLSRATTREEMRPRGNVRRRGKGGKGPLRVV